MQSPIAISCGSEVRTTSVLNTNPVSAAEKYKTEQCKSFEIGGYCKYGAKCQYAHGLGEVRARIRHPKYKTELCNNYLNSGECRYGDRCLYIHEKDLANNLLLNVKIDNKECVDILSSTQDQSIKFKTGKKLDQLLKKNFPSLVKGCSIESDERSKESNMVDELIRRSSLPLMYKQSRQNKDGVNEIILAPSHNYLNSAEKTLNYNRIEGHSHEHGHETLIRLCEKCVNRQFVSKPKQSTGIDHAKLNRSRHFSVDAVNYKLSDNYCLNHFEHIGHFEQPELPENQCLNEPLCQRQNNSHAQTMMLLASIEQNRLKNRHPYVSQALMTSDMPLKCGNLNRSYSASPLVDPSSFFLMENERLSKQREKKSDWDDESDVLKALRMIDLNSSEVYGVGKGDENCCGAAPTLLVNNGVNVVINNGDSVEDGQEGCLSELLKDDEVATKERYSYDCSPYGPIGSKVVGNKIDGKDMSISKNSNDCTNQEKFMRHSQLPPIMLSPADEFSLKNLSSIDINYNGAEKIASNVNSLYGKDTYSFSKNDLVHSSSTPHNTNKQNIFNPKFNSILNFFEHFEQANEREKQLASFDENIFNGSTIHKQPKFINNHRSSVISFNNWHELNNVDKPQHQLNDQTSTRRRMTMPLIKIVNQQNSSNT